MFHAVKFILLGNNKVNLEMGDILAFQCFSSLKISLDKSNKSNISG